MSSQSAEPLLRTLPELAGMSGNGEELKVKSRKSHPALFKPGKPPGPGRPKGVPNKLTIGLREAVEIATRPGQCHPQGFAGWLVDRAKGGIEDRKIFAGVVSRVIPLQIDKKTDSTVRIELGWLNGRDVGRHLSQSGGAARQVIDITSEPASSPVIKDQSDTAKQADDGQAGQAGTQE